jgi:hypothetical protein
VLLRRELILVSMAALWLLVAGAIGVRYWERLVAETRAEIVSTE